MRRRRYMDFDENDDAAWARYFDSLKVSRRCDYCKRKFKGMPDHTVCDYCADILETGGAPAIVD